MLNNLFPPNTKIFDIQGELAIIFKTVSQRSTDNLQLFEVNAAKEW